MRQTHEIVEAIKRCLRARGLTYRELSSRLHLSEASVKRIFAEETLSLGRLEAICDAMEISIAELLKMTPTHDAQAASRLTLAQEQTLASSPRLLTFFYLLNNGWTLQKIGDEYGIRGKQARHYAERLKVAGLADEDSHGRPRCLTTRRIEWLPGGPVMKLYEAQAKAEFLHSDFDGPHDALHTVTGELSAASIRLLQRRMLQLTKEFDELAQADRHLANKDRHSVGLLLAFRPWTFSVVSRLRVKPAASSNTTK